MGKNSSEITMSRAPRGPINELNSCITCKLCKGYFIDATTIIECLHTFCRSCIVKYLESNKYCPICDVQVHKTKPLLNIRRDKTIQDLVYKLVPRLYQNEAKRRKLFYESNPGSKPSISEENTESQYDYILAPDECIDITLNYFGCSNSPRYLRCPSAVTISHIRKLIGAKYELSDRHKVDLFHNQDPLGPSLSLMDVAYIYSWKRTGPLDLAYKIYECRAKKPKLEPAPDKTVNNNNNNNWKEVQLRISENGEMSITDIDDATMSDATEKFESEIVINDSKGSGPPMEEPVSEAVVTPPQNNLKKELPELMYIGKGLGRPPTSSGIKMVINNVKSGAGVAKITSEVRKVTSSNKSVELSEALNLNSELSVIPLSANVSCVSLSSCGGTTTVFSTINKTMCSTKSDESYTRSGGAGGFSVKERSAAEADKESAAVNSISKDINNLKRKIEDAERSAEAPAAKLPKPTILNHAIGLMNLSNNHPLKKHSSKMNRNGERTCNVSHHVTVSQKSNSSDSSSNKPIVINKSLNYLQLNRLNAAKSTSVPCYMPKINSLASKNCEKNGEKVETEVTVSKPSTTHHYTPAPIITPAQLPHHQNLNSLQARQQKEENASAGETQQQSQLLIVPVTKAKPAAAPVGCYKTLRDPPKSWNSQINSQIARVNQNAKAQQMALAQGGQQQQQQGRHGGADLKSVRPAKFFKGRNMPRYLGNPASGVKPMYQVQVSPEKDKARDHANKPEKSEIKKHSIVKIDPKTLKPISEKAPETSNLSNINTSHNQESSRTGDLKISISSVSIFNPLKLQQSSPKNERKSPKSPHSPKTTKLGPPAVVAATAAAATTSSVTSLSSASLSPKQQRDKTNLTFTPPNPFVPNLASPTLNPNQFLYPAGGFPSYDPRFMAACHSLWYTQRIAAAAAAGLVPPPLPRAFGLNMGLNPSTTLGQQQSLISGAKPATSIASKPSASQTKPAQSAANKKAKESKIEKRLETALEKLTQNKAKQNHASDDGGKEVRNGSPLSASQKANAAVEKSDVATPGKPPCRDEVVEKAGESTPKMAEAHDDRLVNNVPTSEGPTEEKSQPSPEKTEASPEEKVAPSHPEPAPVTEKAPPQQEEQPIDRLEAPQKTPPSSDSKEPPTTDSAISGGDKQHEVSETEAPSGENPSETSGDSGGTVSEKVMMGDGGKSDST